MSSERFLVVQYCDDVRQEVGNKFSLMGCYTGELIIEVLPAALPRLCAQVKLVTPIGQPFEKVTLRAYLNDEQLGEMELPVQEARKTPLTADPESTRMTLLAMMNFSPFFIEKEGSLRIEADTDGGVLKGGRLRLLLGETYRRMQREAQAAVAETPRPAQG